MARIRAIITILLLALTTFILIPPQWLAMKFGWKIQRKLPHVWHLVATRLLGFRFLTHGQPETRRPLLIVANHASWVDITVIGSLIPLSFIAKSEVSGWPIFGLFARLQRTVFVNRTKRSQTGQVTGEIADRLASGDAMVLFAEGTSNDGNTVLPFRSALLGAATKALGAGDEVWVQPLSVAYVSLHGVPMGRQFRPHVAWYGDMELADHLWGVLTRGPMDVHISWGEPVRVTSETDRKELARRLESDVRQLTVGALHGRGQREIAAFEAPSGDDEATQCFSNEAKTGKAGA